MAALELRSLAVSEADEYWRVFVSGREDHVNPDPELYLQMYRALDEEAQSKFYAFHLAGTIVGTARLGPFGMVEAPHAITTFSLAPETRQYTEEAIRLALEAARAAKPESIAVNFEESYTDAFQAAGFRTQFSRMQMVASTEGQGAPGQAVEELAEQDLPALAKLLRNAYEGHLEQQFGMHIGPPEDWEAYVQALWEERVAGASWVTRDERGLTGLCLVGEVFTRPFIQEMGVRKDRWRQGLGRALVLKSMEALRKRGHDRIWLEVTVGNDPAIGLYESLGFQQEGRRMVIAEIEGTPSAPAGE